MTSGTKTINNTTPVQSYHNGAPSSVSDIGFRSTKTWSGGDSVTPSKPLRGAKRYYTIRDKRGRLVTRSFRERAFKKREVKRFSPNAYSCSWDTRNNPPADYTQHSTVTGALLATRTQASFEALSGTSRLLTPPVWSADNQIKLIGKLRDQIQGNDFNMSVFLGESHQTLRLIGDAASKLAKAGRQFRKGNIGQALNTLTNGTNVKKRAISPDRNVGRSWLELQYGWLPLLGDMRAGAEQLSHALNVPFRRRYRVRHTQGASPSEYEKNIAFTLAGAHCSVSRQIVALISEPASIPGTLGLLDPELVAWELVPFSFVVDWFVPVGNYLEARAFARRLTGTFVTTEITRSRYGTQVFRPVYNTIWRGSSGYYRSYGSVTRTVSTSLAVPLPRVKSLSEALSWRHCASGIALLNEEFSKEFWRK